MRKTSVYDKVAKYLFSEKGAIILTDHEEQIKKRLLVAFVKKTDDPLVPDKDMVRLLVNTFEISTSQAYVDVSKVEMIFGSFRKANKDYIRHIVNETLKKTISHEENRLQKSPKASSKSLSYAVAVMAKANGLDKEDPNLPDWENIQAPMIEVSDDVTILDLKEIEDDSVEKIRKKFMVKKREIQDAEIIE